ncbi:MAG: hypothetical protein ABI266_05500 [Ginsengibacter sp.]
MEVHHHPSVERKSFREYFSEFLMIFLAVTMGFIAENIRESLSNHSEEKEYVISLKKDLISDTSALNDFVPFLVQRISQTDTLIKLLKMRNATTRGSDLYYLARVSTKMRNFIPNVTTLTELDHSGNYRLITKNALMRGIVKFQKITDSYKSISALDQQEAQMSYPFLANLFDAEVFNTMEGRSHFSIDSTATSFSNIQKPEGNPQLRNYNDDAINQFIFYLHERNGSFILEVGILQEQKKAATELIKIINKEYHLKDE